MTSYETLYQAFFNRIEEDKKFFRYNNVNPPEALNLAKQRAKNYLVESISKLKLKCTLDIDIQLDDTLQQIKVDLTQTEIDLISSLMYEVYLSRDVSTLKAMVNALTSTDLKMLHSPANERKTFMDMYKSVQYDNEVLMDNYNSKDRITGKNKLINYNSYEL